MSTKSGRKEPGSGAGGSYKVGYGKPPKEWRFGADRQPARGGRAATEAQPYDLAALLDRPIRVRLNGKQRQMHPHEAMLHGLFNRVAAGEIRAIKTFLQECKQAGLLEPAPCANIDPVIVVPKEVPTHIAGRLLQIAGPPPWDPELWKPLQAELERDLAELELLKQQELAKARANGQQAY